MDAVGVPTARRLEIPRAPCVVKADGLAAGKGVVVCRTDAELRDGLATVKAFGDGLVVEELLEGPEVSLFAVCDGRDAVSLPLARDYKRAFDGDEGPNTGGMGSVAPVPRMSQADADALLELTVRPVLTELERRHTPFIGTLFVGVILTADGPRVLEYNCRFGDPETQSVLATLDGDLLALLTAAAAGEVAGTTPVSSSRAAVTVVLTAGGYPESGSKGASIAGIAEAEALGAHVFHAGTAVVDGTLVTNGGRVLGVTGVGDGVPAARRSAYAACERISFDGVRYRADIAADAAAASAAG
jgi:phosphoribosylamine--glycine ligase